jgi:phage terminase large subunit-like protein
MRRKTAEELRLSGASRSEVAKRKEATAALAVLGVPLMPQGRERSFRRTWGKVSEELLAAKKLLKNDGAKLEALVIALCNSRVGTDSERETARLEAEALRQEFEGRACFDEPKRVEVLPKSPQCPALSEFIADVKKCRESFTDRMVPGEVLTLDEGGKSYLYPEGDALTVARRYAEDVVAGKVVSGKLEVAACKRFLTNLESGGRSRGFYFDVVEARLVCNFFKFYCTFELLPWQTLVTLDLLCWKKPTGYRLRVKLFLSIARKNGKTAWAGALALFCLLCDQEQYAEVYSFAMTKDQSRICWRDAKRTIKSSPELSAHVKAQQHALLVEDTDSTFVPLSSDSDTADGLRCSLGIGDEIEMWKSDELVDKIITSQLSRRQPLLILTGTAGKSKDQGYCYTQTEIFQRFLMGQGDAADIAVFDSVAVHIFRLDDEDDYTDSANWPKANPSGEATQDWEQIRRLAENMRVDLNFKYKFRRDICNLWNDNLNTGGTLPANLVNACVGYPGMTGDLRKLRESFLEEAAQHRNEGRFRAWGGADVGGIDDFFSLTLLWPEFTFPNQEPKMVVANWYWTISENLDERGKRLNVPLRRWVDERWIKLAGEKFIDRMVVFNDIAELCKQLRVVDIGWDPYRADDYLNALFDEHKVVGTLVPQRENILTQPCQLFQRAVLGGKMLLLDPVTAYCARNVDFTPSVHGGIKPQKPKAEAGDTKDERLKIDGVSSCVNAIQRWRFPDPVQASAQAMNDKYAAMADDFARGIVHEWPTIDLFGDGTNK